MKSPCHREPRHRRNDGQTLLLFSLFILALIVFVGLGVDLGFAYITKAQLSKAVDAATLAGVSNYKSSDGGAAATTNAINTFWANYATNGVAGRGTGTVTPSVSFSLDGNNNRVIAVAASATINTFFIRVLPQWNTLTVGDSAQATRTRVVMTLVLDRSGSMDPNCNQGSGCVDCSQGGTFLPNAVTQFINIFDQSVDRAALVSFASSVTNDVPMTMSFISPITKVFTGNNWGWAGGTFAHGGLTNALAIENSVNDTGAIKVVVFFTDGQANMIQATLTCPDNSKTAKPWNFGGYPGCDPESSVDFFATNTAENAQGTAFCSLSSCCSGQKFPSINGGNLNIGNDEVVGEATNRCIQVAGQMRAQGMYVYSIGLDNGNALGPALDFLQQVANDPASSTFDPTKPVGAALVGNGTDLTQLFQQIASDIILRLIK